MLNRRLFVLGTAATAVLASSKNLLADPLGLPIGCQTYPVRKTIATDFAGTMQSLAAAGATHIELCSPFGYPEFASLQRYKPRELRQTLQDFGLTCISSHWTQPELFEKADQSIAYAHAFGMTQMAVPFLGPFHPTGKESPDDIKRFVDPFNTFAEKAHAAGITALFHNEGIALTYIDNQPVYDMIIAALNPATTKLQFQVSSMQHGYDPVKYFQRYPGRFLSMHCQDWVKDASTESGFRQVALGTGVVDWKAVFSAAKKGGIKNYFVELEDDPSLLPPSVRYLQHLNI